MGQNFSSEPVVAKETERDHNDTFNVAVSSCQGWRMSQEDNHSLILDLPGDRTASFFAVYDGHGSARVSKHASESLWRHLVENDFFKKGQFKEALESAFLTFDREVNESYNAQLAGTTAVCVLIVDNIVYCANIGDSRAVASVNCECIPLSHDHKPENPLELKRILAAGGYVLGNRVNGNLALSRAFGDFHYKGNETLPPELQIVSPCPDIKMIELNDDLDFLVLACDGIWDVLSSEEVVEFVISRLESAKEPGLICEQLTTRCLAPDYELVIGCDNMTVLIVCYTRGRSWTDYCTDIFNKNSKRMGITRVLDPGVAFAEDATVDQSSQGEFLNHAKEMRNIYRIIDSMNIMNPDEASSSAYLSDQEQQSSESATENMKPNDGEEELVDMVVRPDELESAGTNEALTQEQTNTSHESEDKEDAKSAESAEKAGEGLESKPSTDDVGSNDNTDNVNSNSSAADDVVTVQHVIEIIPDVEDDKALPEECIANDGDERVENEIQEDATCRLEDEPHGSGGGDQSDEQPSTGACEEKEEKEEEQEEEEAEPEPEPEPEVEAESGEENNEES